MKNPSFALFFTIVFSIYFLINFYIARRFWQVLGVFSDFRIPLFSLLIFLILAFPLGRFLERFMRNTATEWLVLIGSFYLAIMVYAFFTVLLIDILRLANHFSAFFPRFITGNPEQTAKWIFYISTGLIFATVLAGHLNTLFPRVRHLDISIGKPAGEIRELNAVVFSDLHLGTIIGTSRLKKVVQMVNNLQPDLVFIPGDMVDEDVNSIGEQNMAEHLRQINATYGVFICTGNHEYFSGVQQAITFLKKGNVTVLQDSVVQIAGSVYIAGRRDVVAQRFGEIRKPLNEILAGIDKNAPVILLDHSPYNLDEAKQSGVDLQLSGHTHHGQMFPFNLITKKIYQLSWGYLQLDRTHYYVSCGVGTWGPPVRTGSVPEIIKMRIRFSNYHE